MSALEFSPWFNMETESPHRDGFYEVSIVVKNGERLNLGYLRYRAEVLFTAMHWQDNSNGMYFLPTHGACFWRGILKRAATGEILTTHLH